MEDRDEALLERWRAGDQPSGEALFARYFDPLYRFFSNKCAEPDEMVQTTFLALVAARDQFAGRSSFRTYMFAIARNELYRWLRSRQQAKAFDPEVSSIADTGTTPRSRLARNEDHARLSAALRSLPVEQQTLLELHYWEQLDATALGEIFDLPAAAVRTRLYRARHALRDAMALESVETLDTYV